ncbi:hypothetical protein CGLO_17699 [Colletotrichum gloeosporioides Cg-14]|uniref:Uncharacterized protein n=1 Tax=Colletotrichum gloeosporioides (strain Cg-14) TaxID=1237896 RepID=T0L5S5_COLGC|nr:hypothetical protein CGLO_17699 [Colletotrichum gloeosporioides Cg-14]
MVTFVDQEDLGSLSYLVPSSRK